MREAQAKDRSPLEAILVKKGLASEEQIATAYAQYLMVPLLEAAAAEGDLDLEIGRLLPDKLCRDHLLAPVAIHGETLDVAFVSSDEMLIVDELQLLTNLTIRPLIGPLSLVSGLIERLYSGHSVRPEFVAGGQEFSQENEESGGGGGEGEYDDEILELDRPPPPGQDGRVIRMVNQILEQALPSGPATSTWSPLKTAARSVCDGRRLRELPPPSRSLFVPIVSASKSWPKWTSPKSAFPRTGDRFEKRRQARRSPREHRPHGLRRKNGDADPRQRGHPHPIDRPRLRRARNPPTSSNRSACRTG